MNALSGDAAAQRANSASASASAVRSPLRIASAALLAPSSNNATISSPSVASSAMKSASSPAEQPLDIAELELHVGRPAVIALAGIGGRLHLTQECIHLFWLQAAARAHRAVAGHGG